MSSTRIALPIHQLRHGNLLLAAMFQFVYFYFVIPSRAAANFNRPLYFSLLVTWTVRSYNTHRGQLGWNQGRGHPLVAVSQRAGPWMTSTAIRNGITAVLGG